MMKTLSPDLTDKRIERLEQRLLECDRTVQKSLSLVGYSNPAHFAAAFKCKFGITRSQCLP
ncbi:MAG: helix-turn-helix domain-containing protein [Tolypothrix sp. T3-bin4]|nr:helix-turn-helix domain-containing protein [Tolypothrix sp. Co-bin9]MBD0304862.1 helix-turn-helix domain-containing protein [Tolypothrix sp. T3-bin4]